MSLPDDKLNMVPGRAPVGRLRTLVAVIIVALLAATNCVLPSQSQPITPPRSEECWITIALPTVQLKVNQAWLRAGEANPLSLFHGCPAAPMPVQSFYLGRVVMAEFNAPQGLGQRNFLLHISPSQSPRSTSVFDASEPVETSMTMSKHGPDDPLSKNPLFMYARDYDVYYYRRSNDSEQLHETITCNGPAGVERECATGRLQVFSGLALKYIIGQIVLPVPERLSTDSATEPGAILQFDKGLRKWLVSLELTN